MHNFLRFSAFVFCLLPSVLFAQPGCITPIYPMDTETLLPLELEVSWNAPSSGDPVTMYHFMWGLDPANLIPLGSTTMTSYSVTQFNLETIYYWRVDTESNGVINSSCDVYSYTTIGLPTAPVVDCGGASIDYVWDLETFSEGWTGDIGSATTASLWNFRTGQTPSPNTGPEGAHSGNQYVYYESSFASADASMVSPAVDLTDAVEDVALTFYLHAFGSNMNRLEVGVGTSASGPFTLEWSWDGSIQSNMTNPWELVGLDLSVYAGEIIYLEFKNVFQGGTASGDIAIDKIEVHGCEANIPENNTCINAIALSTGGEPGELLQQNCGQATDSGIGAPSCATAVGNDLFYTVETDVDGGELIIDVTSEAASKMTIVLYDNSCGSLTEMSCATAAATGDDVQLAYYVTGLQGNGSNTSRMVPQDFIVRVFDENNANENFDIQTSGSSQAALPVELLDWTAFLEDRAVRLEWTTATEINSDRFAIEKSRDGKNWKEIGSVSAQGFSTEFRSYSFRDIDLYGLQYYRLRSIDIDGYESLSAVIRIKRDDIKIDVFPNPANDIIQLESFNFNSDELLIKVIGVDGKEVLSQSHNSEGSILLNVNGLSSGFYQLMIIDGQAVYRSSFMKQ